MGVDMDNDVGFDFSALDQLEAAALRDKASSRSQLVRHSADLHSLCCEAADRTKAYGAKLSAQNTLCCARRQTARATAAVSEHRSRVQLPLRRVCLLLPQ